MYKAGEYELPGRLGESRATGLRGRDEYQVVPGKKARIGFNLFAGSRAIIKNVRDEQTARSVYAEYIGL
ncbi:MAG: hypothetical protein LBS37_06055 [Treponema sp.]|jgi:hypothetical protein|nr:hypothetical protein [Treponema sp.]